MFGAHVVVQQAIRFLRGELENLFRRRAERQVVPARGRLPAGRPAFDRPPHLVRRDASALEDAGRKTFPLAHQSQQQMFGLDRRASGPAGLVTGEKEDAPGSFGVALEHRSL